MLRHGTTRQVNKNEYNRNMLTTQLRSQFVTKVLTSQSGEKYKVVFLVALVNGEVKAQVVSAEPLIKTEPIYLAQPFIKAPVSFVYKPSFKEILSPFASLFFFNSQPTRAPAF